jgi:hypothetical protein
VCICATWIDAWTTERTVSLDFASLWAPIMIGTSYYLAAAVIFPRGADSYEGLSVYYTERKTFIVLMLVLAELAITYTYRDFYVDVYVHRRAVFWIWSVPYKLAIFAFFAGVAFARSLRANIAFLLLGLMLLLIPYAKYQYIQTAIARAWGY